MCDYTQVEYRCGHRRYTVRAWCTNYETTHRRCPPSVVAVEYRLDERCDQEHSNPNIEGGKPSSG
ncbi:hypothetical protein DL95DRAFT_110827 [Leptodontidium sp. 2 PMI_412]|nr:hypothetical protein DL95DRAFT_110827 [Leptodontidium sp. 2 PMI_412]